MDSLQGHLLIASPALADPNFARSIVLMVEHNSQGALGLVLNRPSRTTIRQAWEQVNQGHCPSQGFVHVGGPCEGPLMVVHTYKEKGQVVVLPAAPIAPGKQGGPGIPGIPGVPKQQKAGPHSPAKFPGATPPAAGGLGVYFSTDQESVEWLVENAATPIKFFVGYAGWSPGQLESEIEAGGWITAPADAATIFASAENSGGKPGDGNAAEGGGEGTSGGGGDDQWLAAIRILSLQPHLRGLNPRIVPNDPSVN